VEIEPWNRACTGSVEVPDTWSSKALEKPPMPASDIVLHSGIVSRLEKSRRVYGVVGVRMPSKLMALEAELSVIDT